MMKEKQQNNQNLELALQQTKARIKQQAGMAGIAIIVTIVLTFALTVAWYSNIIHTSDLTFEAESWDFIFEGNVTLGEGNTIMAAPGDNGILSLRVANVSNEANRLGTSSDVTSIGMKVNIDKSEMTLMEPRIYFYVDHQKKIQGEVVERQYLSSEDSYSYTIYPGHTLTLSEDYCNDYPIKWEWVYDVVGYYIKGEKQSNGTIKHIEYLRPIVYNPEKDTHYVDDKPITIEGVPVDEFIQKNYLEKDGYPGNRIVKEGDYYKVNDTVYIYLCTQSQIAKNNETDMSLASSNATATYPARIILTGQKANEFSYAINSSNDLVSAINGGYNVLELQGSMTLDGALVVTSGTDVMIDLNGHTLTMKKAIEAKAGSSIGFMNGTIKTQESSLTFMNATASEIYLDNVILEGFYSGIEVNDSKNAEDSHIYISQSEIKTQDSVIWLRGNGELSARKTTLIIEKSTLISTSYIPVGSNGSDNMSGTDIQILNSTLTGYYSAVFHPSRNGTLFIKESTLNGYTGIAIKAGYVVIENTLINATGEKAMPKYEESGYSDTGSAIYVEDNYAIRNKEDIEIIIRGKDTTIKSVNNLAIEVYEGIANRVFINVEGGTYSSDVTKYITQNKEIISTSDGNYVVTDAAATFN